MYNSDIRVINNLCAPCPAILGYGLHNSYLLPPSHTYIDGDHPLMYVYCIKCVIVQYNVRLSVLTIFGDIAVFDL